MPWQKKGSMKYELVEALAPRSSPSCNDVASHSSLSSSVATEDSSYAASLRSHFSQCDPGQFEQTMNEPSENLEPNITRHFSLRNAVLPNRESPCTPSKLFVQANDVLDKISVLVDCEHDLHSTSTPETASSGSTELLELPAWPRDAVHDQQELDQIVEVGFSATSTSIPVPVSERSIRHLHKVIKHSIVRADEEALAKDLRKLADSCLAKSSTHRGALVDHGAVGWITQALQTFPESSTVVSKALRALQNTTCGSVLAREMLHRLNGSALICRAMTQHLNDTKVQRDGCGVLLNYLLEDLDTSRSESFVRVGGLDAVLAAMERYPSEVKLCEWASRVIRALCKTCKHHRPAVWTKGAFTAILNARERHPSCYGIQRAADSATRMFWDEYESIAGDGS